MKIRSRQYLNNTVEQDHRRMGFRVSAMLGFESFRRARRILAGIELIRKLKKPNVVFPSSLARPHVRFWRHVLAS